MNTFGKGKIVVPHPQPLDLYHRRLDTLVRIEHHSDGVVIRTARDNFSNAAKDAFIRYLATEGFIAERFQWCSDDSNHATPGIKWVTDHSWVRFRHQYRRQTTRVRAFLTWGRCLALALFLVAFALALWLKPR